MPANREVGRHAAAERFAVENDLFASDVLGFRQPLRYGIGRGVAAGLARRALALAEAGIIKQQDR